MNRQISFMSAAIVILALALVGAMAPAASAQSVLVAVQNGSTIEYGGATYPIVDNKVTIGSRVYWVRTGGFLIWCDTCTPAPGGTGTTGGTTTCPTTPPADRSYVTVSGTNAVYGGCTYPMSGASVTILGNTYLVGPGGVLILSSTAPTGGTPACPTTPPADGSYVTVSGTNVIYGGCTYAMSGSNVTILGNTYAVGPAGLLTLSVPPPPPPTTCPTTPPADRSYVTVSGTNAIYGGCSYAMTGSYVTILGSTYIVGPGGLLIRTSGSVAAASTPTCPTTPPADRSYVTVSGTNVIYGGCTYPMSGSNVTILGSTYVVGPGGLLILSTPPPPTCPTTPPADRSFVTVSGTNALYGGCPYPMSGATVTILGNTYIVGPGGLLIQTSVPPPSVPPVVPPVVPPAVPPGITGPTGGWMDHHAVYDAGTRTYLLVFQASYNGKDFIWGQFYDEAGAKLHSNPFLVSKGSGYEYLGYAPRVAASGDGRFLVSYAGIDTGFSRIVQAVEYDGGVLVGAPVKVDGNTSRHRSDVAWLPQTQRFMVTWTKYAAAPPYEQEAWAMPVTWDGVLATAYQITRPAATEVSPLTYPALAVGSDGNVMVVGYRDCTGAQWAPPTTCGIYRTLIDGNGIPIAPTENILYGQWSRYANVVFNPVDQVYQVVWVNHSSGGQIYGMRYSLSGTPLDLEPYVVQAPDRTNTYLSDDAFSQVSLAYDPAGNDYLLAFRGQDPPGGDGKAVVLSMVATADGRADGSGLVEVDGLRSNSPSPVVVVTGGARVLVFYNYNYSTVNAVPFTR